MDLKYASKKMKNIILTLFLFTGFATIAQTTEFQNGFTKYFYPNGTLSSEGTLKEGKPNGYWKTYFANGKLKSEGNRKNFLLDSLWIFYSESGDTVSKINYNFGQKNGYYYTYQTRTDSVSHNFLKTKEMYVADVKEGKSYFYDKNGKLSLIIPFEKGKKQGIAKEFENDTLISLIQYHRDYLAERETINRRDHQGRKQGTWKEFYDNDLIKSEKTYLDNNLHGYWKEYDQKGKMTKAEKYQNGVLVNEKMEEPSKVEIKNTYYANGVLKSSGGFKDGKPVGIQRDYNEEGKVNGSKVYDDNGVLLSTGIVGKEGDKFGNWKDFYESGKLKAKGKYKNNKRIEEWTFYFENGAVEQIGNYKNGKPDGEWKWYYGNGKPLRIENFSDGKHNGLYVEYEQDSSVVVKGIFIDGERDSIWFYQVGDEIEEGEYRNGLPEGKFKHYYRQTKQLKYEGEYVQGNPDGKHKWYYENGNLKEIGNYIMGEKHGDWLQFDEQGLLLQSTVYEHDKPISVDGIKLSEQ